MPSTLSLINRIRRDFPGIRFAAGDSFYWSPHENTVFYADNGDTASLVHELAHAALGHSSYKRDIDLLKMERDAWEYAATSLAERYGLELDDDTVQDALDTYRNWLHARSICPECQSVGIQVASNQYACLACKGTWQVNEARFCALRRHKLT